MVTLLLFGLQGCAKKETAKSPNTAIKSVPESTPLPEIPPTLKEILDNKNTQTESQLKNIDFSNYTYPLPRGWQDIDSKEVTLNDGERPVTEEKIGIQYLTRKFGDVTGDGNDEAFVILKVKTGGAAIPLIVYIFEWKNNGPNLIWYFRTGDRAAGGLKRIYAEEGELVLELFGRDRYIYNQMETSRIVGDEVQLCCPTQFTHTKYKQKGNSFELDGDRYTYSLTNPDATPEKNLNEKRLEEESE